ncbi:MAG: flagellar biosynthetic protein FliO [Gemmatimonadota bacterium]|nr:flagellar biosynthetic protein FliO [Gemmatimonadota bacterium]
MNNAGNNVVLSCALVLVLSVFCYPAGGFCRPYSEAEPLGNVAPDTVSPAADTLDSAEDSIASKAVRRTADFALASRAGGEGVGGGISWFSVIGWILAVIGILILFLYLLKRFLQQPLGLASGVGNYEVLKTFPLGPRKSLCLVRVCGRLFLLGMTESSITRIAEYSDPEESAEILSQLSDQGKEQGTQFSAIYQNLLGRFKK